jgi:hypothetical protein
MLQGREGNIPKGEVCPARGSGTTAPEMHYTGMRSSILFTVLSLIPAVLFGATGLVPSNVTVGQNLQADAMVGLTTVAPAGGLDLTLTSSDPSRALLALLPDAVGAASITVKVSPAFRVSPTFYVQGLANSGVVSYTASAPGYGSATGKIALAASGIVIAGPARFGNPIRTTFGRLSATPPVVAVYSAQLDSSGNFVVAQPIRAGSSAIVNITNSNPEVGTIDTSRLTIVAGSSNAATQFQTRSVGETTLSVDAASGFKLPAQFTSVKAIVSTPKLTMTEGLSIGANLEIKGAVLLGAPAPQGGVTVTLTSSDTSRLLLSPSATAPGSKTVMVAIPAGATNGPYYLQALTDSGTVTYTAEGPGYGSHTATITLAPSGVVIAGPSGPPDEAEILRPESPLRPGGFFSSVAGRATQVLVYTAYLDPKTRRGADITVQALRAGMSLTVGSKNSNPAVGTAADSVTIVGGSEQGETQFKPLSVGSTELSVTTPEGFTTASNSTTLKAVVK